MNPFKPKRTFSVAIVALGYILVMFYMKTFLHVESYREDHYPIEGAELSEQSETSADSIYDEVPSKPTDSINAESDSLLTTFSDSLLIINDTTLANSDSDYFEKLLASYKATILENLPSNESRTDIVVRYYQNENDGEKVKILSDYGYYLHRRPAVNTTKQLCNSLYYGDSINSDDIRIIAYLLIQNGVPIRQIVPSKFHDGWKSNAIEIGTDTRIANKDILTKEELAKFQNPFFEQNLRE